MSWTSLIHVAVQIIDLDHVQPEIGSIQFFLVFFSVIDYDHTHVFAFCFVSFIMDENEKQEFSFYSMIINILESILMLNHN